MRRKIDIRAFDDGELKPKITQVKRDVIHIPIDRKYIGMTQKERNLIKNNKRGNK